MEPQNVNNRPNNNGQRTQMGKKSIKEKYNNLPKPVKVLIGVAAGAAAAVGLGFAGKAVYNRYFAKSEEEPTPAGQAAE